MLTERHVLEDAALDQVIRQALPTEPFKHLHLATSRSSHTSPLACCSSSVVEVSLLWALLVEHREFVKAQLEERVSNWLVKSCAHAHAIPHVAVTMILAGRVVTAVLVPVDEPAPREAQRVPGTVSSRRHNNL